MNSPTSNIAGLFLSVSIPAALLIGCGSNGQEKAITAYNPNSPHLVSTTQAILPSGLRVKESNKETLADSVQIMEEGNVMPINFDNPELGIGQTPEITVFHFDVNAAELHDVEQAALKQHAEYLMKNSHVGLIINGYADSRGSAELDYKLSKKRAETVKNLLHKFGVDPSQLIVNSYGESFPVNTESNWDENRRVKLVYQTKNEGLIVSIQ